MQRWDEEWCFPLLFLPNGMQIAICLSRQLWMCTIKQGAFEHTVTLLIMWWRNTGRRKEWAQREKERGCRDCFNAHLAKWTLPNFLAEMQVCDKTITHIQKASHFGFSIYIDLRGKQNGPQLSWFSDRGLNVIISYWHHLHAITSTPTHTPAHKCSSWPFRPCQAHRGFVVFHLSQ